MRLGDFDALKAILFNDTQYGFWHDSMDGSDVAYTQRDIFKCIDSMPTIDAVPVVQCRHCQSHHWEQEPCHGKTVHYCKKLDAEVTADFFCAAGKRKNGDGNG